MWIPDYSETLRAETKNVCCSNYQKFAEILNSPFFFYLVFSGSSWSRFELLDCSSDQSNDVREKSHMTNIHNSPYSFISVLIAPSMFHYCTSLILHIPFFTIRAKMHTLRSSNWRVKWRISANCFVIACRGRDSLLKIVTLKIEYISGFLGPSHQIYIYQ